MYDPASAVSGTEAVFAAHPEHAGVVALRELATDAKFDRGEMTLTVERESVIAACEALKAAGYNFLEDVTAVDWYPSEPRFEIVYHILSFGLKQRVRLVAKLVGIRRRSIRLRVCGLRRIFMSARSSTCSGCILAGTRI